MYLVDFANFLPSIFFIGSGKRVKELTKSLFRYLQTTQANLILNILNQVNKRMHWRGLEVPDIVIQFPTSLNPIVEKTAVEWHVKETGLYFIPFLNIRITFCFLIMSVSNRKLVLCSIASKTILYLM